jgi:hypothetical protein
MRGDRSALCHGRERPDENQLDAFVQQNGKDRN